VLSSSARPDEVARVARAELLRNVVAKAGLGSLGRELSEKLDAAAQQAARCWASARDRVAKFARDEAAVPGRPEVADEAFRVASVAGPEVSDAVGVVEVCWSPSPSLQAAAYAAQAEDLGGAQPWSAAASGAPPKEAPLLRALPREYSTFVSVQTFRSLSQVYTERGHAPRLFVPRLFELALLYETLAAATTPSGGGFGAFELALPDGLLNAAHAFFNAQQVLVSALFARPGVASGLLGTAMPLRVDACWGSAGTFADVQLDAGSFLLHVPTCWTQDAASPLHPPQDAPLRHLLRPLARGFAAAHQPLSFLLVVSLPRRPDGAAQSSETDEAVSLAVEPSLRPFLRAARLVPRAQHSYEARRLVSVASGPPRHSASTPAAWAVAVEAANHHRSDDRSGWAGDGCDAMLCVLQNEAGARTWPASDDALAALTRALAEAAAAAASEPDDVHDASSSGGAFDAARTATGLSGGGFGGDGGGQSKAGGVSWAKVAAGKK
jgi:hypothetical protein